MEKECAFLLLLIMIFSSKIDSKVYPSIQWDPRNPIFKVIVTVPVLPTSKLNLVCPNKATILAPVRDSTPKEQLHENIWVVDKRSYDSCTVNTSIKSNRLLKKCAEPLTLNYFPMVFQQYSATDQGLEFTPGDDYYFIATSDGTIESLNDTWGGHCKTANMRIKIHICRDSSDPRCDDKTTTSAPEITTTHPPSPKITSTLPPVSTFLPNLTTTRPPVQTSSPKIITCQPPVQTSLPTVATDQDGHKNPGDKSGQHKNDTPTTPGSQPITEYSKSHEPCDELKYQLPIAFLLALVFSLSLLTVLMYLNFYRNLSFRWLKRRKMPRLKDSTAVNLKHQNSTASTRHMVRWSVGSITGGSGNNNPDCNSSNA